MPKKRKIEVSVARLTQDGSFVYPWATKETSDVTFSPTFSTCYYGNIVLVKIKSGPNKGNYRGVEDGEVYRIWQHR